MADGQLSPPTPPTPPTPRTEDDRLDRLRLVRSRRVGAVTFHRLMAEHGSARAALAALPGIARAAGVEAYEICPLGVVQGDTYELRDSDHAMVLRGNVRGQIPDRSKN